MKNHCDDDGQWIMTSTVMRELPLLNHHLGKIGRVRLLEFDQMNRTQHLNILSIPLQLPVYESRD